MESCVLKKLLWCKQANHDKIWGWVETPSGNMFRFWGRRSVNDDGSKRPSLQFRQDYNVNALLKLMDNKMTKGYNLVDVNNVEAYVPGFEEYFEEALLLARLSDKVLNNAW